MSINYNNYRFGWDEDAVGRLINGDLPANDQERYNMVEAPKLEISKLLKEHLRAQTTLRECQATGKPFILFLRSFSSEYTETREGQYFSKQPFRHSTDFQRWLKFVLEGEKIPIIKLQGGSDSFFSDKLPSQNEDDSQILLTTSTNWEQVATELIQAASVIVFLVGYMSVGVVEEVNLIRRFDKMQNCFVVLLDPKFSSPIESLGIQEIRNQLVDFPHIFEILPGVYEDFTLRPNNFKSMLKERLSQSSTSTPMNMTVEVEFTYLEPKFANSNDYRDTEENIWRGLRQLRVIFEDAYWSALESHGIAFDHLNFQKQWVLVHRLYGLAIATADFHAIKEALSFMYLLYIHRGADLAFALLFLQSEFDKLAENIFKHGVPDTETQYAVGTDPLKLAIQKDTALKIFLLADTERNKNSEAAHYFYQIAVIYALKSKDDNDEYRNELVAHFCLDWAQLQVKLGLAEWGEINYRFAIILLRDLVKAVAQPHIPYLFQAFRELGDLLCKVNDFSGAEAVCEDAMEICKGLPTNIEKYLVYMYTSLGDIGFVRMSRGKIEQARGAFKEALPLCEQLLVSEPLAIVDMVRLQCGMSLCLSKITGASKEALEYAQLASENLKKVEQIHPESMAVSRNLVEKALLEFEGDKLKTG